VDKDIVISKLNTVAQQLRQIALTMIYEAQAGHPGGSFSAADIVAALYFHELQINPSQPQWPDRDRFVMSKGHVCPILYAALGQRGYFPEANLHTLRQENSLLQGHPDMKRCPGIDISTGSLGQGASCAVGMALAGKRDHKDYRVFTMVGDGEMDEGIIWEAMMTANKYQLDNYILIVDNNGFQADGAVKAVMPQLDLSMKAQAFGFETYDINGNDMGQILDTFSQIRLAQNGKPKFINAHTVKGKGVNFMENDGIWHSKIPNHEQYVEAMKQLKKVYS